MNGFLNSHFWNPFKTFTEARSFVNFYDLFLMNVYTSVCLNIVLYVHLGIQLFEMSVCFHAGTVHYFFQFFHCVVCSLSGSPIWRQYSLLLPLPVPGTAWLVIVHVALYTIVYKHKLCNSSVYTKQFNRICTSNIIFLDGAPTACPTYLSNRSYLHKFSGNIHFHIRIYFIALFMNFRESFYTDMIIFMY